MSTQAMAQFVIERTGGEPQQVEGNVTFSRDATSGDFAVGDTYQAENSISGISAIYRAPRVAPPKVGDYYYSDGTWSDGGLVSIDADGLNPVWAEEKPAPVEGKTVIGIVFQTTSMPATWSWCLHSTGWSTISSRHLPLRAAGSCPAPGSCGT